VPQIIDHIPLDRYEAWSGIREAFLLPLTFYPSGIYSHVMTMSDDYNDGRWVMAQAKTQKIDMRVTPAVKELLQVAADASNRPLSEFVLESAIRHAEEILPDRRHFGLNDTQWAAFQAALDAPPRYLPRVAKLFSEPSRFERE
jgi:uncharacterized protein (DUF1778 family)